MGGKIDPDCESTCGAKNADVPIVKCSLHNSAILHLQPGVAHGAFQIGRGVISDHPVLFQGLEAGRHAEPVEVVAVCEQADFDSSEHARHQARLAWPRHADRDVRLPRQQVQGRIGQHQLDIDLRVPVPEPGKHRRHYFRPHELADRQAHSAPGFTGGATAGPDHGAPEQCAGVG